MNNYSKRVYEMLVRVQVFRTSHQEVIGDGSQADTLLREVEAASEQISAQLTLQTSGSNDVRIASDERTRARDVLRSELETLSRTAASMGVRQFFMPRQKGDRATVEVGKIFVALAEPLKDRFIANHLAPDFLDHLRSALENLERAIQNQVAGRGVRKTATAAIAAAQSEALAAMSRLEPLMENVLRGNPAAKAAWAAARRIDKRGASAKKAHEPEVSETAPDSASAVHAA